jgi:hypothetical protein
MLSADAKAMADRVGKLWVGAGERTERKNQCIQHEKLRLVLNALPSPVQKLKRDGQIRAFKQDVSMPRG